MKLYERVYDWARILFWVLYGIAILGLWHSAPHYLEKVDAIFKIFVGAILIYLCNPWNERVITSHHKKIIFEAGIMLLLSSSIKSLLSSSIKSLVQSVPIIKKVV